LNLGQNLAHDIPTKQSVPYEGSNRRVAMVYIENILKGPGMGVSSPLPYFNRMRSTLAAYAESLSERQIRRNLAGGTNALDEYFVRL
jgi:hypothetical protein